MVVYPAIGGLVPVAGRCTNKEIRGETAMARPHFAGKPTIQIVGDNAFEFQFGPISGAGTVDLIERTFSITQVEFEPPPSPDPVPVPFPNQFIDVPIPPPPVLDFFLI
jgi:hypothetical protein